MEKETRKIEEFDFKSIVNKNSSMSDFRQVYLKKRSKIEIDSSTIIHRELVRKHELCNNLLNMYLKREILTKLPRVRYKFSNELWEVKIKSEEIKLTTKMKSFLQIMSERGFEFLQNEGVFQHFVEINNLTETFVLHKGEVVNLKLGLDIICPQDHSHNPPPKTADHPLKKESFTVPPSGIPEDPVDITFKPKRQPKGILKRSKHVDNFDSSETKDRQNIVELNDSESDDDSNDHMEEDKDEEFDVLILNFILSLRKSISAEVILKQFLSKLKFKRQKNLLMVFHLGPLLKDQEIVLYEYICNKQAMTMIQEHGMISGTNINPRVKKEKVNPTADIHSQDNPQENGDQLCSAANIPKHFDLDKFIKTWTANEDKLVHEFSDSKDSIKDSIYEYQGLEKLQCPTAKKEKS